MEIKVSINGDKAIAQALGDPALVAGPLKTLLGSAAAVVERKAAELAPVDTGRLRSSITQEIAPLRARVYTNVFYAPFVEYGTRPHFPPPGALATWGRRHGGIPAFALARAIAKRGTKAQPYMRPGAQELERRLPELLANLARDIEDNWRQKHGS